jgi:hypothetical protein
MQGADGNPCACVDLEAQMRYESPIGDDDPGMYYYSLPSDLAPLIYVGSPKDRSIS